MIKLYTYHLHYIFLLRVFSTRRGRAIALIMIMIIIVNRFNYQTMIIVIMIISPGASSRPTGAISLENKNAEQRFQEQVIIILIMKRTYRNENHYV